MDILYTRFSAFLNSLDIFESTPHVAVGVSGGPDSLALAFLMDRWVREKKGTLHALTVDHGLRPDSHEEAHAVKKILSDHGIFSTLLSWEGQKPAQRIQECARIARYALLETYCWEKGIFHLFIGHHKEDQAETFLSRLGKKSGLSGLCGMYPIEERGFGQLIRPLLDIPKKDLITFLESKNIPFFVDPSNAKEQFERVKLRQYVDTLQKINLTSDTLSTVISKLQKANGALEEEVTEAFLDVVTFSSFGWVEISLSDFLKYPEEIQCRVLESVLQTMAGRMFSLRSMGLERVLEAIKTDQRLPKTLGHCLIRWRGNTLFIVREESSLPVLPLPLINKNLWGDLFYIESKRREKKKLPWEVRPLGKKGAAFLQKEALFLFEGPSYLTYSLPSLWKNNELLSVPHLNFQKEIWDQDADLFSPICAPYIPLRSKIFSPREKQTKKVKGQKGPLKIVLAGLQNS